MDSCVFRSSVADNLMAIFAFYVEIMIAATEGVTKKVFKVSDPPPSTTGKKSGT